MVLFLSMRRSIIKAATAGLTVLIASSAWATTFELDSSHSEVGFRVRHFTVSWTRGRFDVFSGTLNLDEKAGRGEVAWERRGARFYFYRSVRNGGQVRKEYGGTGVFGELAALMAEEERRASGR